MNKLKLNQIKNLSFYTFLVIGIGICYINFIHIHDFHNEWMDTWCYVGPVLAAEKPFEFRGPLVGDFLHFDKIWAIYPPGQQILMTVYTWFAGNTVLSLTIFILAAWFALAILAYKLIFNFTQSYLLSYIGGVLILTDRAFYKIANGRRAEILAAFLLTIVVYILSVIISNKEKYNSSKYSILLSLFLGVFFLILIHPITTVFSHILIGIFIGLLIYLTYFRIKIQQFSYRLELVTLLFAAFLADLFLFWFFSREYALEQFLAHLKAHSYPFEWGRRLFLGIQETYPLYSGHILFIFALFSPIPLILKVKRSNFSFENDKKLFVYFATIITILFLIFRELFVNPFYISIVFSLIVVLAMISIHIISKNISNHYLKVGVLILVPSFLILSQSAWSIIRFEKYLKNDMPNIRREISLIFDSFPKNKQILLPEIFWADAVKKNREIQLITPPIVVPVELKQDYQKKKLERLNSGDWVVVDKAFPASDAIFNTTWTLLDSNEFEIIGSHKKLFQGPKGQWGYDLTIYQKK